MFTIPLSRGNLCAIINLMTSRTRVLVVDDEPRILHFIRVSLNAAGYDVTGTTSGEEALQLIESEKPDIILLDILMVPLSGFEVLERLRCFSRVPVIVFTGRSDIGNQAVKAGANGVIAKPFQPEELVGKIEDILSGPKTSG